MNNLEICKRIAEIERVKVGSVPHLDKIFSPATRFSMHDEYNPLTDGNLLQSLVKKYGVHIYQNFHDYWIAEIINEYDFNEEPISINPSVQKEYEWAACLAIIEAHKDV